MKNMINWAEVLPDGDRGALRRDNGCQRQTGGHWPVAQDLGHAGLRGDSSASIYLERSQCLGLCQRHNQNLHLARHRAAALGNAVRGVGASLFTASAATGSSMASGGLSQPVRRHQRAGQHDQRRTQNGADRRADRGWCWGGHWDGGSEGGAIRGLVVPPWVGSAD